MEISEKSRQRTCHACTDAKRRCDKTLPSCLRCLDRDVACSYPPLKRRRHQAPPPPDTPDDRPPLWVAQGHIGQGKHHQASSGDEARLRDSILGHRNSQSASSSIDRTLETSASSTSTFTTTALTGISRELALSYRTVNWFLPPSTWDMAYDYHPPINRPPPATFDNFIRGLQAWLVRYLREGHSPFIHRHLYNKSHMPPSMQGAIAALALAQTTTPENEHLVDAISSSFLSTLLTCQSHDIGVIVPNLSTRDQLARTQALLIHLLLALFSPSISRRATAETHLDTLLLWARQLWNSANIDAATSSLGPNQPSSDPIASLHQTFILSESVRRTFILANIATGVYLSLRTTGALPTHVCDGDVCLTFRAGLWDAPSAARWEARALSACPLFLHSLKGQTLFEMGVPAADVDEFARHVLTVVWGLDQVERWAVRTGDTVSVTF